MIDAVHRTVRLVALCMLVTACATSPERQAQLDGDRCTARGYQPGSKGHDDCLSQVQNSREVRMQQRHREVVERPVTIPGR